MGNIESDSNGNSDSQPNQERQPQDRQHAGQWPGQEKKPAPNQKQYHEKRGPSTQRRNRSMDTPTNAVKTPFPTKSVDILPKNYKYSFQFEVKNFPEKNEHISQVTIFDDCHWQLVIQARDQWDVTAYLRCLAIKGHPQRKVCTSFRVGILKQDRSQEPVYSKNQYFIFSNDLKPKEVPFQDAFGDSGKKAVLLNPDLGLVKNNSITFQVDVNTFSAKTGDNALSKNFWLPWNGIYPDVTLLVGVNKNPIKVHRQIMAMNCSFLKDLLYPNFNNNELPDCDYQAMMSVVRYLYSKEVIVTGNKVRETLYIARKFGLDELLLSMFSLINAGNAVYFVEHFDHLFPGQNQTNIRLWNFLGSNMNAMVNSDAYKVMQEINPELIKDVMSNPEVKKKYPEPKARMSTASTDSGLCVICLDRKADILIIPCNHLAICSEDAAPNLWKDTKKCPVCRGDIKSFSKVFLP